MDTSPVRLPPHKSYPLGRLPPVSFLGREPATLTRKAHPVGEAGTKASLIAVRDAVLRGYVDPEVRAWAIKRLKDRGNPEDQVERARVLLTAIRDEKIWVPDPPNTEYVQEARLTLGEGPDKLIFHGGDCFAEGTLLLGEGMRLIPVEEIQVGTRIWGLDKWVRVEAAASKGTLPIDVVVMNNGSQLRLTADHHVNVLLCPKHPHPDTEKVTASPCSCPAHERTPTKMRVGDLRPGMVLPTPERLPFGDDESLTPERAYIEGLYLADGWSEEYRFAISGQDGCPKEQTKREVEAICNKLGVATCWNRKYLRINDPGWNRRMKLMGTHAPDKHLLSLNLAESQTVETLRGLMADSHVTACGSRTFTSTSHLLMVQLRVLHKMLGVTCGWQYIESHGGLGKHPIWRLHTRKKENALGRAGKLLRVHHVEHAVEEVPCYDIQTEDHNVYLPEHDVTVLNCDDLAVATLSAYLSIAGSVGCYAAVVGHSYARDGQLSHVLGAILAPGPDGERWYYVEPSSKKVPFGESYEPTREVVYIVPGTTGEQPDCDAARCLAGSRAVRPPQQKPQFFGVSGPPPAGPDGDGTLGAPGDIIPGPDGGDPNVMPVPSPIGENDKIGLWLLSLRNNLAASRENLLKDYDALSQIADASGHPLPSPDAPNVFQPQAGDTPGAAEPPWTAEDSAYVRTLTTASDQLLSMMDRILKNYQPLMWVESIKNFGMRYEPEDRYEIALVNDRVVLKDRGTSSVSGLAAAPAAAAPVAAAGSGLTIAIIVILALVGVAVVSTAYFIAQYNDRQAAKAAAESQRRLSDLYDKCLSSPNCTPAQRELIGRAFGVQSGALSPAPTPQPGAYGTGEGFGWSWLAWPLIGATVIAFLFSTEKVYTRQSNRSRRFQQRAARDAAKTAAAQKTAKGGRYVYGQVIGTRPDGTPIIEATDAQPTPSWGQRVAGAVLGL